MSAELEKKIKQLERKLKLSEQVLKQHNTIHNKYNETMTLLKQKEHFTSTVIESNKNAIIAMNENQVVIIFNKSAEDMFGYTKEEMLNKESLYKIIPEYLLDRHAKAAENFIKTKKSIGVINNHIEVEGKRSDGTIFPIRIGFGVELERDNVIIVANIEDITFEKKANDALKKMNVSLEYKVNIRTEELKQQYKYLQSVIDGIKDPVMVIQEDYSVSLMNASAENLMDTQYILEQDNPKCYEISHHRSIPCDGVNHPCPLRDVLKTKNYTRVVHNHPDIDGNDRYAELAATPLFDHDDNCIGIIESARDITSHLETQKKLNIQKNILHQQAYYDGLTGLANRTLFNDTLEIAISKAQRRNAKLAVFFIDLDRFKQINDSLGHNIGDMVLKVVAERLKVKIRNDTLARLGGDEFTILMEDIKSSQQAVNLARKIIKVLERPLEIEGHILYVSSSIGISLYPEDALDASSLLRDSDAAMYKAKDEGKNNFQFYSSEMTEIALERVSMEASLRQALENDEFVVYYQAQTDGLNDKLIGMEALVRWNHPTRGLISPNKFIPLAEETGLVVQLDRWVMLSAMKQVVAWYKQGLNPGKIALNLSIKQLEQDDFISTLIKMIETSKIKPEYLELEITESSLMSNPQSTIIVLKKINELGIELAIDDFGTGYSSLSYLKRLPINKLKIDQEFVKELPFDEEDVGIAKAVIALSKSLNLRVIAEGVETQEQKDFLVNEGCSNIQGYFYSKPIPVDEMEQRLIQNAKK